MFRPVSYAGPQPFNDWFVPDTVKRVALGTMLDAYDSYWGFGRFLYVTSTTTMAKGTLAMWTEAFVAAALPSTAGQGFPFGVLMESMITGQYGWLQISGFAPASASASVAADGVIAVAAAGQVGAAANGKQLLGARNRFASTATVALTNVQTFNGSSILLTNGYDGWFVGMALSGTGIPASTVVAKLDPDGRTVSMGSAIGTVDKLATASGLITATGTYTGYVGIVFNNPFAQGAVV